MATKNMSEGKPSIVLLTFAIPIIISVCFQQLYNIADSIIAGQMISNAALAAVTASYPITVIYLSIATGFAAGSSVIIARIFGNNDYVKVKSCISTVILTMLAVSALLMIVGYFTASPFLKLMRTPSDIFVDSKTYLEIYIFSLSFMFLYNATSSIFQALGNAKIPLFLLIFSTILNIILDIVFIKYCNMGVNGLAWGTFIAQGVASLISLIFLLFYIKKMPKVADSKPVAFSQYLLKKVSAIAIPSIIQSSTVSIGQLFVQTLINGFGMAVVAGYGAAFKINYIVISIFLAVSSALTTFVSQNIGAGRSDRLKAGLKSGMFIIFGIAIVATTIYLIFPKQLLGLFVSDGDEIIQIGVKILYILSPFYIIAALKIICDGFIRGAGDIFGFTTSTMTDLVARVGLSYLFVFLFGKASGAFSGCVVIWWTWPIGWVLGAIVAVAFLLSKRWKKTAMITI